MQSTTLILNNFFLLSEKKNWIHALDIRKQKNWNKPKKKNKKVDVVGTVT